MHEPDPRLSFLYRAHARLILVEEGVMSIGEVFDDLVGCLQCACSRELLERWERNYPPRACRRRA
jgi:hypothetical protein